MMILLADFIVMVLLLFGGILFYRIGPPSPPPRIVSETHTATADVMDIQVYVQERAVRWSAAAPLFAAAAVGVLLLVLPRRRAGSL
jgi:hypothetical protein